MPFLLAWPTFGLSLVVWFAILHFKSKNESERISQRNSRKVLLEPLFNERFDAFFRSLDVPVQIGAEVSNDDAFKCGRHIMTYIAHNSEEGALFISGLKKWQTKGSYQLCDPITAAQIEKSHDIKGEIHLVSYRAIEALMTNNERLHCFHDIDLIKVKGYLATT